jgi:hypothetical protein
MKWETFKKLTPLERRRCRKKTPRGQKVRKQNLRKFSSQYPNGSYEINSEIDLMQTLIKEYFFEYNPEKVRNSILHIMMNKAQKYPKDFWGSWNDDNEFIAGMIPLMADLALNGIKYEDELDEILSKEDLSSLTQADVVRLASAKGVVFTIDALKKRINGWDK